MIQQIVWRVNFKGVLRFALPTPNWPLQVKTFKARWSTTAVYLIMVTIESIALLQLFKHNKLQSMEHINKRWTGRQHGRLGMYVLENLITITSWSSCDNSPLSINENCPVKISYDVLCMYSAKLWQGKTLVNWSYQSFGEENVAKFTIATLVLSKILVYSAKFAKVSPPKICTIK